MHGMAYPDDEAPRYQPLRSHAAMAVYSARVATPEQLRAAGKTRKAAVHGVVVQFMLLSPSCKDIAVWNTFWHEEYHSEAEAQAAAAIWAERLHCAKPGVLRGQA